MINESRSKSTTAASPLTRLELGLLALLVSGCAAPGPAGAVPSPGVAAKAPPAPLQSAPQVYPFGMCSNPQILDNPDYSVKMLDAGARMCRMDAAIFPTVRPREGDDPQTWNWAAMDKVRRLKQQHPNLDYLGLLGYGAAWAQDPKYATTEGGAPSPPQRGIEIMPAESPGNVYGNYVYETVKRYHDVVKVWEPWNEPDLPGHAFFKGDGHEFYAYQKACYLAAKKADPTCTVIFAAMCYPTFEGYLSSHGLQAPSIAPPTSSFFEEYLQESAKDPAAKAHNYYFDVMNQHSYSRASDLYDYPAVLHALMKTYLGTQKPVWITEMGFPEAGGIFGGSADDYCDYILQSYAWGQLAGVQKFFHFQLDNSNGHGLYYSIPDKPKPALVAYRDVLVKELAGARLVGQTHGTQGVGFLQGNSPYKPTWKAGYNLFEFKSLDGKRHIWMAFADTEKPVTIQIPAQLADATLVDRHNVRSQLKPAKGFYDITLAGATNIAGWPALKDNPKATAMGEPEHLVGGATVLLVEGP